MRILTVNEAAFQSTLPMRGATLIRRLPYALAAFQSTLPMRGATVQSAIDPYA